MESFHYLAKCPASSQTDKEEKLTTDIDHHKKFLFIKKLCSILYSKTRPLSSSTELYKLTFHFYCLFDRGRPHICMFHAVRTAYEKYILKDVKRPSSCTVTVTRTCKQQYCFFINVLVLSLLL